MAGYMFRFLNLIGVAWGHDGSASRFCSCWPAFESWYICMQAL